MGVVGRVYSRVRMQASMALLDSSHQHYGMKCCDWMAASAMANKSVFEAVGSLAEVQGQQQDSRIPPPLFGQERSLGLAMAHGLPLALPWSWPWTGPGHDPDPGPGRGRNLALALALAQVRRGPWP